MKRTWLLILLLAIGLPATATDLYSWTDASGVKHFSDAPPPASVVAQKIKVKGGVTTSTPVNDASKVGPSLASAAGYTPEDIKHNCDIAQHNVTVLQANKPPLDADGYPVDLAATKAHQAKLDKAAQQIALFCTK